MSLKLLPFEITVKIIQDIDNPYALAQMDTYCRNAIHNELISTFFLNKVNTRLGYEIELTNASKLETKLICKTLLILQKTQLQQAKALGYKNLKPYSIFLLPLIASLYDPAIKVDNLFRFAIKYDYSNIVSAILDSDRNQELTIELPTVILATAFMNSTKTMKTILDSSRALTLEPKVFGEALRLATEKRHKEIVSILVNCSRSGEIPLNDFTIAYETAAGIKDYISDQRLLSFMEITCDQDFEMLTIFYESKYLLNIPRDSLENVAALDNSLKKVITIFDKIYPHDS